MIITTVLSVHPGPGPFPGVLDMWGGGGGLVEYRAALLASHGFVAFALEYLTPDEIKDVSVSYFEVIQHKAPHGLMICTYIL